MIDPVAFVAASIRGELCALPPGEAANSETLARAALTAYRAALDDAGYEITPKVQE